MNDHELLELAAKAAGVNLVRKLLPAFGGGEVEEYFNQFDDGRIGCWNPLTDDGDALRLAVKLNLNIHTPSPWFTNNDDHLYCDASWWDGHAENWRSVNFKLSEGGDPYAATRRAIVRAAAEFGRRM